MTKDAQRNKQRHPGEDGYLLVGVIVLMALVLFALAVAAPVVARDLRRDKEVESMHRAEQYVRAIRLYQRKFPNQYPPSIEALEKSNNIRFLRQQYIDPLTGKADWRIIHVGQNQTTVKGFFGEPLGGLNSTGAGLGSAAGNVSAGSPGAPPTCAPVNGLAGGFANAGAGCTQGSSGTSGASGSTGSSDSSSSSGGGPIMGVGTARNGSSILTPNDQSTYETWEFLYDPRIELMYKKGSLNGGIGSRDATAPGASLPPPPGTGPGVGNGGGNPPGGTTPIPQ